MPTTSFLPVLDWLLEQGRVSEQPSFSSELLSGGSYGGSAALSFSHPPGIVSRMYLGKAVSVLPSKQGLHFCANISLSCVCARASACAWRPPIHAPAIGFLLHQYLRGGMCMEIILTYYQGTGKVYSRELAGPVLLSTPRRPAWRQGHYRRARPIQLSAFSVCVCGVSGG